MTEIIIPESSIERIYPTENDVGGSYRGVRGTEGNISNQVGSGGMYNGILSNRDGNGISLGVGGFELQPTDPASLVVTYNLGIAHINGYYINCVAANTVNLTLDAEKTLYVYLKLVKSGGIIGEGGSPGGALKIVASEAPVNLSDYTPLNIIQTDANGVIKTNGQDAGNQWLDIREHALRDTVWIQDGVGLEQEIQGRRPSWDGGCVFSGLVQLDSISLLVPDTYYSRIEHLGGWTPGAVARTYNWWRSLDGLERQFVSIVRSPLIETEFLPILGEEFFNIFNMQYTGDVNWNSAGGGFVDNTWISSDW